MGKLINSNFSDNSLDLPKLIEEALVEPPKTSSQTALSVALSTILCRHNSRHSDQPASILICEDSHCGCIEHISFMNTVFEAQRQGIKIDVISSSSGSGIGDELLASVNDEVLLRQAASITGGYYLELNAKDADSNESLLPLLFSLSMGTRMHPSTTGLLNLPSQGGADFRGACFCHGRIIDMGFVCSVCLSGKVMNGGMAASLLTSFV